MSKLYVETHNRVFSIEIVPGDEAPGCTMRRAAVWLESGQPLSEEEAREAAKQVVADLVAQGIDVIGWEAGEGDAS